MIVPPRARAPGALPVERLGETLDLGRVEPPMLVFGGPYSNLQATVALRAVAERMGIPPWRTLCTGDVVAYGGDPEATTSVVRDWGVWVVRGNCEESLAAAADGCGCGFPDGSVCDRLAREWYPFALAVLSDEQRRWMGGLPSRIVFRLSGIRVAAIHAGVDDRGRFIFASTDDDEKRRAFEQLSVDVIIAGHSGLPFTQRLDDRVWHNAGVIGQPANDGTSDVWFSIIDVVDERLHVRHHRLDYDHAAAAAAIRRRGLADAYADALTTGLWPGCDVLPASDMAARGRRLTLERTPFVFPAIRGNG